MEKGFPREAEPHVHESRGSEKAMVNFELTNVKEAQDEAKKWEELKKDIAALDKVVAALEIYDFLAKHPKVKTWGVVMEKAEYNDEGLGEGVYADYTAKGKEEMCGRYDEYDYPDCPDEIHEGLNRILSAHWGYTEGEYPSVAYASGQKGMLKFIQDHAGEKYAKMVAAGLEKKEIGKAALPAAKRAKKGPM